MTNELEVFLQINKQDLVIKRYSVKQKSITFLKWPTKTNTFSTKIKSTEK